MCVEERIRNRENRKDLDHIVAHIEVVAVAHVDDGQARKSLPD